ncbi:sodium (Na+) ABC transporter ATP binding protein [Niallia circulans]|uniref:ABC transporter ATP-binding protein n=1 Tax=Niallia circulans TaxID=1397 RepID=UPI00077CAB56|nr:ABC transporter ATP-binding protein [Niallia circulans]MDR4316727.1 ABC transporter ATP-binding protein [Niallia circulans]MED3840280.1 ABC transporter ATP-binding protein [Niallia circulans]MED4241968.1 ABC transporter ATP-binding protein [Niallia circulans]MED4249599.1 ABC transporter ATP-binding protein [Niallia circulans]NRG30826.1 ABC transporter ATP-binding protein [Niallia circulans]
MIEAKGISKYYTVKKRKNFFRSEKQVVCAVKDLNISIKEGEIVGLLGLNGAGKTTTIKMLSTLLNPTEGQITIDGFDAVKEAMKVKKHINMIAGGERMLYWRLTGSENLRYFGKLYQLSGLELEKRIAYLLDQVGLKEAKDIPVELYSKGMKQRLQIARGLINDPKYLFLDEPTLGLDAPVAKQLRGLVKNLAKQEDKGILLTSHYLEEVEELCDRIYIIEKGSIILDGTPEKIISSVVKSYHLRMETSSLSANVQNKLKQALVDCSIQFNWLTESTVILVDAPYDPTSFLINICMNESVPILKLELKRPRLEDAILALAKEKSA